MGPSLPPPPKRIRRATLCQINNKQKKKKMIIIIAFGAKRKRRRRPDFQTTVYYRVRDGQTKRIKSRARVYAGPFFPFSKTARLLTRSKITPLYVNHAMRSILWPSANVIFGIVFPFCFESVRRRTHVHLRTNRPSRLRAIAENAIYLFPSKFNNRTRRTFLFVLH